MTIGYCVNNHSIRDNHRVGSVTNYPDVFLFHIDYFLKFFEKHPDCLIGSTTYPTIFDCYEDDPEEHLYSWYCDKCKCLAVYIESTETRYDFRRMERDEIMDLITRHSTELQRTLAETMNIEFDNVTLENILSAKSLLGADSDFDLSSIASMISINSWDRYVAVRKSTSGASDTLFQQFEQFCIDRSPVEILTNFKYGCQYYLSPDKRIAYGVIGGKIDHGFLEVRKIID